MRLGVITGGSSYYPYIYVVLSDVDVVSHERKSSFQKSFGTQKKNSASE